MYHLCGSFIVPCRRRRHRWRGHALKNNIWFRSLWTYFKTNINKIQILQNKILKTLYTKDWKYPTDKLHKELNLLKIQDIFELQIQKFTHKQQLDLLPSIFQNYFKLRCDVHNINTRQANDLHLPKFKTETGKKLVKYYGTMIYGNLDNSIKNLKSIASFAKHIKSMIMNKYRA